MTSQGLGIRTPERGLGPLVSLVVFAYYLFLLFRSSHCKPPDPCHTVRILMATRAIQPLPLLSHQKLLLSSFIL